MLFNENILYPDVYLYVVIVSPNKGMWGQEGRGTDLGDSFGTHPLSLSVLSGP